MSDPLRIWHVDINATDHAVDGVAAYVNAVAAEQVQSGHSVTVFSRVELEAERRGHYADRGIRVVAAPRGNHGVRGWPVVDELHRERPDVVQFHGAWVPRYFAVGTAFARRRIPYVYTPHGGLSSVVRSSKAWRRSAYTRLVERRLVERASGVALVVPAEAAEIADLAPGFAGVEGLALPPAEPLPEVPPDAPNAGMRPRVVYLGRFEVVQKAIDDVVELARHAPEIDVDLYGSPEPDQAELIDSLTHHAPANVRFREPVFGVEKARVLAGASAYLQLSRFEGFPVSVAEAMMCGRPVALSSRIGLAGMFKQDRLGTVLPPEPRHAARALVEALSHPDELDEMAARAQQFARTRMTAARAATDLEELYLRCLHR